jgi:hypothetical protein
VDLPGLGRLGRRGLLADEAEGRSRTSATGSRSAGRAAPFSRFLALDRAWSHRAPRVVETCECRLIERPISIANSGANHRPLMRAELSFRDIAFIPPDPPYFRVLPYEEHDADVNGF